MSRLTRRRVLAYGLAAVPTAAATFGGVAGALFVTADTDTSGGVRFANPLAIPPLARSREDEQRRHVFDLRAAPGRHRLRPGPLTPTWGVNGPVLGPTLRASRGETVLVNLRNDLPEPTTLHWHGAHLPARMDGGPHQVVAPGETWSPTWTVDQPAATLWYHPHPHGETADHAYRGLGGLFILDDDNSRASGLPSRYGVDDIPVIVQDKRLRGDNTLDEGKGFFNPVGVLGDLVLVNGTPAPYLDVVTERVRLRLLNASNARTYRFGFADDSPFVHVATDGGLLALPYETTRVQLSPGERAEIVVTMRPGQRLVLRSYPPDLGVDFWNRRFSGGDDVLDVLELRAAGRLAPSPPLPDRLADPPRLTPAGGLADRRLELSGFAINGRTMDPSRIDFAVTKGTTEVWEVTAVDGVPHNLHVHGVQFQVLSVGGAPPPPELRGWKDTVYTPPNRPVRIALRFDGHADRDTPFMVHCHLLWHEDSGLMGQFVVVEPGEEPAEVVVPTAGHHH